MEEVRKRTNIQIKTEVEIENIIDINTVRRSLADAITCLHC